MRTSNPDLISVLERIDAAQSRHPPEPWSKTLFQPIGGLASVGFAPGTELLLVTSSSGRGVFDGATGQRLARDDDDDNLEWEDHYLLEADGIGPLKNQRIRLAGLYGGGLPETTPDGWESETLTRWPEETLLLVPPGASIYGGTSRPVDFIKLPRPISSVRAFGFSSTGRTLVIATSSDVTLYSRSR